MGFNSGFKGLNCKFSSILLWSADHYYCISKLFRSPLIHNSHCAGLQLVTFSIRLLSSQVAIRNTSFVLWTREKTGITLQPRLALSSHILWYFPQRQYIIGTHDCNLDCKPWREKSVVRRTKMCPVFPFTHIHANRLSHPFILRSFKIYWEN